MKLWRILLLAPFLTMLVGCGGDFGTYSLVPGETRTIEVRSNEPKLVAVALVPDSEGHERAEECPLKRCVSLEQVGTYNRVVATYGDELQVIPKNGRMGLVVRNLSTFPIKVQVSEVQS